MDTCINCNNPTVILHPYAKSYFIRFGVFVIEGVKFDSFFAFNRKSREKSFDMFVKRYVNPFFSKYKSHPLSKYNYESLLSENHFIDSNGVLYPLFILVPCGKCSLCTYSKVTDISSRCALETYTSKCKPLFVTLTYNNENLPADGSVSIDDIQKFLKLLRINLNRFFATPYIDEHGVKRYKYAKISLRYLYASEYTPNNGRPHYHLLIWNVPYFPNGLSPYQYMFLDRRCKDYPSDQFSRNVFNSPSFIASNCVLSKTNCDLARMIGYDALKKLIWCSWHKGFVQCAPAKDASGSYVSKYIGKGSTVPKGCKPCFCRWSTRRGLGFDAFDFEFKDLLLKNPSLTQITFMDSKVGRLQTVKIPKYYKALLCPSLSVIAKPFRDSLERFHHLCCILFDVHKKYHFSDRIFELKQLHSKIYHKYELFVDLCLLSTRPCVNYYGNFNCAYIGKKSYPLLSRLFDECFDLYSELNAIDLESIHLSDILNYKYLHSFYVSDYVKSHPIDINVANSRARKFYQKVDRQSRQYSF